jgi:hypothetical protein
MLQAVAQTLIHVPGVIGRLDETEFPGGRGIAKDLRMVDRIDAIQAAWPHASTRVAVTFRQRSGRRIEQEGSGYRDVHLSQHFAPP